MTPTLKSKSNNKISFEWPEWKSATTYKKGSLHYQSKYLPAFPWDLFSINLHLSLSFDVTLGNIEYE